MIRLVASCADDVPWREIAPRLRGAAFEVGGEASPTVQAVVFGGSHAIDSGAVEGLLHAGKHVLVAAAPCWSWDGLEALLGAARRAGVQFAVVNPDRCLPSRQLIKGQIGYKLGNVGLLRMHRWEPVGEDRLPGSLLRDLDVALWLVGKPPDVVYALGRSANVGEASRFVQVHLGFSPGMALIDCDHRLPPGAAYQSLSVIAATGAAYSDDHQNMQLVYRSGQPRAVRTTEGVVGYTAMVQEFVDALAAGRDLSATVTAWRDVLRAADAVRQSLASRRAVLWEGLP